MRGLAKRLIWTVITPVMLALAACNPVANLNAGDSQIAKIHAAYSRGDGDAIYAMTGSTFRATTSRAEIGELVDVFQVRLGAVRSSERSGFHVNTNTAGTFTTITMPRVSPRETGRRVSSFPAKAMR